MSLKKIVTLPRCGGLLSRLAYEHGRKEGIDVKIFLRQAGLTPRDIKSKDSRLRVQDQIKFVALVANATADRLLGFHLASPYDLREIGLFYYVIASGETLLGSLLRAARYSAVANDGVALEVRRGNRLRVRLRYSGVARHTDVHQIDFWMASLVRMCRKLIGTNFKPIQISIMHDRSEDVREMQKVLGCAVKTGADVDEIVFPGVSAEYPIVTADPYLNRLCVRVCEETLARLGEKTSPLKIRVENTIAPLLLHREVHIGVVAARLGMGQRTLARRLAAEGHSFSGVLNGLRRSLAHRYLAESNMPISEIAWLLGYSQVGAFTNAFRRWTGTNPRNARAKTRRSNKYNEGRLTQKSGTTLPKRSPPRSDFGPKRT